MQPNKKRIEFIRLVANGEEYGIAYKLSIGKKGVSKPVSHVKGSQLAKRYASEIAIERENLQKVITQAKESEVVSEALKGILSQAEVDKILTDIINGELFEIQQLNSQGKVFKAKISATIAERKAAIEAYNKRFGSNLAIKVDHTTGGDKIQPIVINLGNGINPDETPD